MIKAIIKLSNATGTNRQFVATSGSGHHILIDDAVGGTGAKPIELVAIALAGCTAFDVIQHPAQEATTRYRLRGER